jgi:riboflavin synthase alpha subunit
MAHCGHFLYGHVIGAGAVVFMYRQQGKKLAKYRPGD